MLLKSSTRFVLVILFNLRKFSDINLGISQLHHLELQACQNNNANSDLGAGDVRPSTLTILSGCQQKCACLCEDKIVAKALEIIGIARKAVQADLEELKKTCLNLEDEVKAVTARQDLMGMQMD